MKTGKRGHHEGSFTPLEGGGVRWRVRVRLPDGTAARRTGTARTMTEARRAVDAAKAEANAGRRPVSAALTVGELVTEYMGAKAGSWAQRTAWNNAALYRRHILPHLGNRRAAGLTPAAFRAYFEARAAGGLGDSGLRQLHVLLSGSYKRAIGDGALRDNPLAHARPVKAAKKGAASRVKAFTPAELGRFLAAALEDRWALPLAFLGLTGMRIGEALALTWADFERLPDGSGRVTVSKTRSEFEGKAYEDTPKTAAGVRALPVSADAVALIEDMRRRVALEADGLGHAPPLHIFPSVDGRPMRQDTARAVMRRTCERAGVPLLSPHALRHSFATLRLAEGRDVVTVAAYLGHAKATTTLGIYAHALPDRLAALALDLGAVNRAAGVPALDSAQADGGAALEGPAKEDAAPRPAPRWPRKGGPRRRSG